MAIAAVIDRPPLAMDPVVKVPARCRLVWVGTAAGMAVAALSGRYGNVVVIDAVVLVLVVACERGITRLIEALTQWVALRARIELARIAAAAPPGTEVAEQDRRGGSWRFRSQQPGGEVRE